MARIIKSKQLEVEINALPEVTELMFPDVETQKPVSTITAVSVIRLNKTLHLLPAAQIKEFVIETYSDGNQIIRECHTSRVMTITEALEIASRINTTLINRE